MVRFIAGVETLTENLGSGPPGQILPTKLNLANGVYAYIDGTLQPHVGQTSHTLRRSTYQPSPARARASTPTRAYVPPPASPARRHAPPEPTSHPPARPRASTPMGHHVPATGQSSQTPCAAGTYQPSTEASCIDADAGPRPHHRPVQTACARHLPALHRPGLVPRRRCGPPRPNHRPVSQTPCAAGTYQPPPAKPRASTPTRATTSPPPASPARRHAPRAPTSPP